MYDYDRGMITVPVHHYDAFSSTPGQGNPAGVVLDADSLSESDMQAIARKVGFNETVFVLKLEAADLRLKYFTPGHEINLCGHATMAALYCLKCKGLLKDEQTTYVDTNVGILPIHFDNHEGTLSIEMKQDNPQFKPFQGNVERLAESIGLTADEFDLSLPIVYGSTGAWTLLIPIKRLSSFQQMKPNNPMFPELLLENPKASLHPFCMETSSNEAFMHARHFSSPYSGTVEDPVTGTASGVMGAYYLTYMKPGLDQAEFVVEQGHEIQKDGRVFVKAVKRDETIDIHITGTAVFVNEMQITWDRG